MKESTRSNTKKVVSSQDDSNDPLVALAPIKTKRQLRSTSRSKLSTNISQPSIAGSKLLSKVMNRITIIKDPF